jgi:hypothetical protein
VNASNTPKIFILAACVIFYSTLPSEASWSNFLTNVKSDIAETKANLTGNSEADKALEDGRSQQAKQMAASTNNHQTLEAFLKQNKEDALARQAAYEAEETARVARKKTEEAAAATEVRDFAQKNFAVPFLAFLEQGIDPVEAYAQTMGQIVKPRKELFLFADEDAVYVSNRVWKLEMIDDPIAQREALKTVCNGIGSLCSPRTAVEINEKITKCYEDKDKETAFMQKNFAAPLLAFLEQGMEPFAAHVKSFENLAVAQQEAATNKQACAEFYKKQLEGLHSLNDPAVQRKEMAGICQMLSSLCEPDTALKIKSKITSYYYSIEKQIFTKRADGRSVWGENLDGFTFSTLGLTPSPDTVYPYERGGYCYQLKVLQSVKGGVLICGENPPSSGEIPDKNLFIKTKRQYADNDLLKEGCFIYTGLAEYKTVLGVGAKVHSFEEIENPKAGLFFY